jgi:hypothetical protein
MPGLCAERRLTVCGRLLRVLDLAPLEFDLAIADLGLDRRELRLVLLERDVRPLARRA